MNINIRYFPFGRYRFQDVKIVAIQDPQYVLWWEKNVVNEELSNEIISLANKIYTKTKLNK